MSLYVSFSKVCNEFISFIPEKIASALDIKISNTAKLLLGGAIWAAILSYAVLKLHKINFISSSSFISLSSNEKIEISEKDRKTFETTKANFIFDNIRKVFEEFAGNSAFAPQGAWSIFSQFIQALPIDQQTKFKEKISGKNSEEFSKIDSTVIAQLDGEAHKALKSIKAVESTNTFEYRSDFILDENYKKTMSIHYECSSIAEELGEIIAKWTNNFKLNADLVEPFEIEDKDSASLDFYVTKVRTAKGQAMTYRGKVKVCELPNVLAVAIPYKDSKLSWVLILPHKDKYEEFLNEAFNLNLFKTIKKNARKQNSLLKVPYTKIDITLDLKESMDQLYQTNENFEGLSLAALTQKTQPASGAAKFIQTGFVEHGPESVNAVGLTEMVISESYIIPKEITFNRPYFSFVLDLDNPSQILTAAYVDDPSKFRYEKPKN